MGTPKKKAPGALPISPAEMQQPAGALRELLILIFIPRAPRSLGSAGAAAGDAFG